MANDGYRPSFEAAIGQFVKLHAIGIIIDRCERTLWAQLRQKFGKLANARLGLFEIFSYRRLAQTVDRSKRQEPRLS